MDLKEIGWKGVDRTQMAHDRNQWQDHVNTVMTFWVTQNVGNFLSDLLTSQE
jgi:hypothetical protein